METAASDLSLLFVSELLELKNDQTLSVCITFQSKNGNTMPCFGFHATSVLQTIQAACPTFQNKGLLYYVEKSALDFMMLWHCDSKYDHQIKEGCHSLVAKT